MSDPLPTCLMDIIDSYVTGNNVDLNAQFRSLVIPNTNINPLKYMFRKTFECRGVYVKYAISKILSGKDRIFDDRDQTYIMKNHNDCQLIRHIHRSRTVRTLRRIGRLDNVICHLYESGSHMVLIFH